VAAALQRLAPEGSLLRDDDVAVSIAVAVEDARAAGGRLRALATGVLECADLAQAAGRARLGGRTRVSEGSRAGRPQPGPPFVPFRFHHLRTAVRGLLSAPSHVALVVATLALGIGINTAVFSVLDSILFRPVPYPEQHRLALLWTYYAPGKFSTARGFTAPLILEWRKQTDVFDRVEASERRAYVFEDDDGAEMLTGAVVTPGLLGMLGAQPRHGRIFVEGDGRDGTDRLVLISERLWRVQLHGAPDVVGRELLLDGERHQVIGVLPSTFRYPDESHDVWLPVDPARPPSRLAGTRGNAVVLARAATGVPRTSMEDAVMARGAELNRASGGDGQSSARVIPLGETFDDRTTRSLLVLAGAVAFLLVIVCANAANLTLSRAIARGRDRAVRAALGASRADLVREAMLEHAVVGAAGALLGVAVAQVAILAVLGVLPETMTAKSLNQIDLDGRALLFLCAASGATVLLFGSPPALAAARGGPAAALQQDSRSATGSALARRLRAALVVAEVALSIVLLVGAALVTRSLMQLQSREIGLDPAGLAAIQLALPSSGYADPTTREAFMSQAISRLKLHPGVIAASGGSLPFRAQMIAIGQVEVADRPGEKTKEALFGVCDTWPGYFAATGIRLIDGREPTDGDVPGAAVVSAGFAAKYWPGHPAVGRRFKVGIGDWRTVVGVATEVRALGEDDDSDRLEIYYPHDQVSGVMTATRPHSRIAEHRTILVRADGPTLQELAGIVHQVDPRVVVAGASLVERMVADAIARPRIVFLMMTVFAASGLLLAAAGVYGVLSYLVAQRVREIGIRLALGAPPAAIGRLVVANGLVLAAIGLAIGIPAALVLVRVMRTILYEVEPTDPLSVTAVSALLLVTAALASWRPAWRAMRVDPVNLLRA
jgi:putative ABC transport system permease protein